MIKTFKEAVEFLESYVPTPEKKHPGEWGLKRMEYLMKLLGNPQLKYPTIHVGGTSGKGSTATIIAQILSTKYTVGLHTSPHLETICERIKIKIKDKRLKIKSTAKSLKILKNISENELVDLLNELIPYIKRVEKSKWGKPSYFEITAGLAFWYFAKKKVDIAVIEVGMGGKFDGTNVVNPLIAVLTNVGLDHTEVLGETVEEIARDKAGIIKPDIQVVSGVKQPSIVNIINKTCKEKGATLSLLERDFRYKAQKLTDRGSIFTYFGEKIYRNLKLPLLGEHQVENACLAIRAVELFNGFLARRQNFLARKVSKLRSALFSNHSLSHISYSPHPTLVQGSVCDLRKFCLASLKNISKDKNRSLIISTKDIRKSLISVYVPGRLEIISKRPLVILDGAHNGDKAKALTKAIKTIFPKKKVTAVVAIKTGKNAQAILEQLVPICQRIIFTRFKLFGDLGEIVSYDPQELEKMAKRIMNKSNGTNKSNKKIKKEIIIVEKAQEAVREAIKQAKKDDLILVTGSLYLVGEIKKNFQLII